VSNPYDMTHHEHLDGVTGIAQHEHLDGGTSITQYEHILL